MNGTTSKEIVLDHPDNRRITEVFRDLPKRGTVRLTCSMAQLQKTLYGCEKAGFFALQIKLGPDSSTARVTAWKGKTGPCFETGRSVRYRGGALAVLDDDHHFIFGSMRVCEKTGGVYRLPPYVQFLEVTEADQALLARLEADPVPFNCDTFEKDSAALITRLAGVSENGGTELCEVLYPGPFRLLVLDDGSVVRRGVPVRIPEDLAEKITVSDGLILDHKMGEVPVAGKYQELYATRGAAAVLDDVTVRMVGTAKQVKAGFGVEVFVSCLPELLEQLRRMIERNAPYVVFSGSDPADPLGCCPSEQVGQANRLVEAGVLSKYEVPAPPDSCNTTFFACAGEIEVVDGEPRFSVNVPLREKIGAILRADS